MRKTDEHRKIWRNENALHIEFYSPATNGFFRFLTRSKHRSQCFFSRIYYYLEENNIYSIRIQYIYVYTYKDILDTVKCVQCSYVSDIILYAAHRAMCSVPIYIIIFVYKSAIRLHVSLVIITTDRLACRGWGCCENCFSDRVQEICVFFTGFRSVRNPFYC